mgnify:FL=1
MKHHLLNSAAGRHDRPWKTAKDGGLRMEGNASANEALRLLMAEMILDKAIREYREKALYLEIDKALAAGDEAAFLMLTNELRSLQGIA